MQKLGDGAFPSKVSSLGGRSGEAAGDCEAWPYLDRDVLLASRSRKVCMTRHWFRHHAGAQCIPLLTCQLHQGLIAQGDHLLSRCQGWTDDMTRRRAEISGFSDRNLVRPRDSAHSLLIL